ncbi:DUF4388 domain-containing protein [Roseisolibacter agri]|uniref:PatA-like N-terminal domain-containing protein n=1 Tax=Roseisolibacter agri TaxID=2014610 RepID=A0AA37QIK4_9BACT|nr:DUF4388 domain-containing protein [Roseisolibacter agri]GLC26468.1 hypothetical protein rosag_29810 [Roseisolibacter agri]
MSAPVLEGSLRELALADVLQLLELGRRTGTLRVVDEPRGLVGEVDLADGAIGGARLGPRGALRDAVRDADVQAVVCALLDARIGRFGFLPTAEPAPSMTARRLRIEGVLVEAARRADEWARLADDVPHAGAVPVLSAGEDASPVSLDARRWALLAEIDGSRDVVGLAASLGRDPLDLAAELAELVRLGVVACRDAATSPASDSTSAASDVPSAPVRSSSW